MNWDRIEGNWKQFKGQVKEQWGRFTDDELRAAGLDNPLLDRIAEARGAPGT